MKVFYLDLTRKNIELRVTRESIFVSHNTLLEHFRRSTRYTKLSCGITHCTVKTAITIIIVHAYIFLCTKYNI